MPEVRLARIISCSSEHASHPASNLLLADSYRRWRGSVDHQARELSVIVQFSESARINAVHIGNDGAAFVEVQVAKLAPTALGSDQSQGSGVAPGASGDYQVLLPASSFMSPKEARVGEPTTRVRLFSDDKLDQRVRVQKWECARIVCTQPFNKAASYGLAFVKFFAEMGVKEGDVAGGGGTDVSVLRGWRLRPDSESSSSTLQPGGLFARKRNSDSTGAPTGGNVLVGRSPSVPHQDMAQPPRQVSSQQLQSTSSSFSSPAPKRSNQRDSPSHQSKTVDSNSSTRPSSSVAARPKQSEKRSSLPQTKRTDSPHRGSSPAAKKTPPLPTSTTQQRPSATPPPTPSPKPQRREERVRPPRAAAAVASSATSRRACRGPPSNARFVPNHSLLAGVTFTLSGYQNPRRSQLRQAAMSLGARYSPDWGTHCTHVVCAFANTPKLARAGRSVRAVRGEWLEQCADQKRRLPWRRYATRPSDGTEVDSDSDLLVWDNTLRPQSEAPECDVTDDVTDDVDDEITAAVSDDDAEYTVGSDDAVETDTDDEIEAVRRSEPKTKRAKNGRAHVPGDGWLSSRVDDKKHAAKPQSNKGSKKRSSAESGSEDSHSRKRMKNEDDRLSDSGGDSKQGESRNEGRSSAESVYHQSTDSENSDSGSLEESHVTRDRTPDFFTGLTFYMHIDSLQPETRRLAEQFAVAFGGSVAPHCGKTVNYIVSSVGAWCSALEELVVASESAVVVRPSWLFECNSQQYLAPVDSHTMLKPQ